MGYFRVDTDKLNKNVTDLNRYSQVLYKYSEEIESVDLSFFSDNVSTRIRRTANVIGNNLSRNGKQMYRMSYELDNVIDVYRKTENGLIGGNQAAFDKAGLVQFKGEGDSDDEGVWEAIWKGLEEWFKKIFGEPKECIPIVADNDLFNDESANGGYYGGNQESPLNQTGERREELWEIASKNLEDSYFGQMKEDFFFNELNEIGCGYVACANIIFQDYLGREDEFKNIYGFDMYYNGKLNYDALSVYLFSKYFNIENGTTPEHRQEIIEGELGEDINFKIYYEPISNEKIARNLDKGNEVIINAKGGSTLYTLNPDGTYSFDRNLGGPHTMEVTGVTEDGYLIVSSWGKKYYLNPNENFYSLSDETKLTYEIVKH